MGYLICFSRTYLKNHFAPLCGLNITAEIAKKRKENPAIKLLIFIFEMAFNLFFLLR
jgi:hypothetical protein